MTRDRTPILAVFCDFENVALGVRDAKYKRFDIRKVLERLLLKGSIVVKKAYCDWDRYKPFKPAMHEAAFELIEIPHLRQSGKNSADIRLVVDALDLCYTKSHVNTFVIISGDSDFSPLVSKLRENDKEVIGVGVANSSSDLLIANCDEFIYYDDLVRSAPERKSAPQRTPARPAQPEPVLLDESEERVELPQDAPAESAPESTPGTSRRRGSRRGGRNRGGAREGQPDLLTGQVESGPQGPEDGNGAALSDSAESAAEKAAKGIELICETVAALMQDRGEEQKIWGSMVKQTLRRRRPGFNESFHGFRSFNAMLEEAEHRGRLRLEKDDKSGGYIILPPHGAAVVSTLPQVADDLETQPDFDLPAPLAATPALPDPDISDEDLLDDGPQPLFNTAPPVTPPPARRRRAPGPPKSGAPARTRTRSAPKRVPRDAQGEPDGNRADPVPPPARDADQDDDDTTWNV